MEFILSPKIKECHNSTASVDQSVTVCPVTPSGVSVSTAATGKSGTQGTSLDLTGQVAACEMDSPGRSGKAVGLGLPGATGSQGKATNWLFVL